MARKQEFNTDEALHHALGAFWNKGYEATSLADLLQATGLSKSSLYNVFGCKRELFLSAFDAYRKERGSDMIEMLSSGTAREGIERFFRKIVMDAASPDFHRGCMSINQAVEMAPRDPEVRDRVTQDFQAIEDLLTGAIDRAQTDGSISSRRTARDLAKLLVLSFPGLQVMTRAGVSKNRLDSFLDTLLSILDQDAPAR
ncbi:TetR/AcrR family transcriptional regulator [Pelagicoccus sp. SDUM812002]|uniref:TetR/AcrR family transcriptional regulator n=1 Tax=Pelagicoccus sp. SDUM812002 TaxID=3041266 RepID=UPI0028103282|nr:TetR/AcrR family transcriptional regulator [Pelagicoccus sp. SDUM812002]MDQ8185839.1 TetR/AcrR family transcriptional regulator [Pelagicoccus sp. SDUM812002]